MQPNGALVALQECSHEQLLQTRLGCAKYQTTAPSTDCPTYLRLSHKCTRAALVRRTAISYALRRPLSALAQTRQPAMTSQTASLQRTAEVLTSASPTPHLTHVGSSAPPVGSSPEYPIDVDASDDSSDSDSSDQGCSEDEAEPGGPDHDDSDDYGSEFHDFSDDDDGGEYGVDGPSSGFVPDDDSEGPAPDEQDVPPSYPTESLAWVDDETPVKPDPVEMAGFKDLRKLFKMATSTIPDERLFNPNATATDVLEDVARLIPSLSVAQPEIAALLHSMGKEKPPPALFPAIQRIRVHGPRVTQTWTSGGQTQWTTCRASPTRQTGSTRTKLCS